MDEKMGTIVRGHIVPFLDSIDVDVPRKTASLLILGERIRDARKRRGWTQEDLAHESQLDRSYIGGVERGERNLSFATLSNICGALGCDVAALTKNLPGARRSK